MPELGWSLAALSMDTRTFVVEMTRALAWPLAAVAVVLVFRRSVVRLLPHLTRFKYDKFEVQFAKELAAVERQAEAALPPVLRNRVMKPFVSN